jgi:RNA:NAD 2'-phosphotransferase (TPT1/KptA family)
MGGRHGPAVVVDSAATHHAGHVFYRSINGVWRTDHVASQCLKPAE